MSWIGPVAALLTGVALLGILAPFLRHRRVRLGELSGPADDERLRVLRSLRDLERDRDRGALAEAEYERQRQLTEARAVALIRGTASTEAGAELAAALRRSHHGRARPRGDRRARPSHSLLVAGLVAVAVVAAAVPMLVTAVGARAPGGFITGAQPSTAATTAGSFTTLEQQVRAHPDDMEARLDLAQSYLEAGQARQASQQYVEVLKRDPNNPEATTRLALLLYEAGDTDDAMLGVNKVLSTHPDYPEALFLQGVILLNALNRPKDAVAPLRRYLQVAPSGGYRADAQQLLQQAEAQGG